MNPIETHAKNLAWIDEEIWKPIPGFTDYLVSDLGNIRSLKYSKDRLKKSTLYRGYPMVGLSMRGERTLKQVHQIVLLTFVGVAPVGMEVRHLDGNSTNNRLDNLTYGTHKENVADTLLHGTHAMARKTECIKGHPFDEENTYIYKSKSDGDRRGCKACHREREKLRRLNSKVKLSNLQIGLGIPQ